MAITVDTIDHVTLKRLVEAGAVRGTSIVGQAGGWGVVIQYGMTERVLAAKRGAVRIFRKFETLVGYLKGVGIVRFDVDAANWDTDSLTARTRPDASEAMKKAHEAAAYDKWLKAEVQEAIDDTSPTIPHEEVKKHFASKREALRQRIAAEKA